MPSTARTPKWNRELPEKHHLRFTFKESQELGILSSFTVNIRLLESCLVRASKVCKISFQDKAHNVLLFLSVRVNRSPHLNITSDVTASY